ncbi:hypothetical protein GCM10010411_50060 [Actinomadura fulvescens]|uniref:Uncharacterized protein n=1 Tax=Actinomadura fulvescens TaxID=46160 RepID=A0ABN3Q1Z6_9ACTN
MRSDVVMSASSEVLPPSVGERNSAAKLTESKVRAIRTAYAAGGRASALAEAFGVSPRAVRHIVRGTSWTHL